MLLCVHARARVLRCVFFFFTSLYLIKERGSTILSFFSLSPFPFLFAPLTPTPVTLFSILLYMKQ